MPYDAGQQGKKENVAERFSFFSVKQGHRSKHIG